MLSSPKMNLHMRLFFGVKILGYRFDDATIKFLLGAKWWNKSDEWLLEHCDEMCDVEKLKGVINDDERS